MTSIESGDLVPGLVSVVIPVHNRPRLLVEAAASALDQTHRPLEILIVDDGSTDETPRVAAELARAHPGEVHVLLQENAGPGVARETGRRAARGEYVQYLDSDDLLLPRKLEFQVAALRGAPEAAVCYGIALDRMPNEGPARALRRTGEAIGTILPSFLVGRWWTTECPLYRREIVERAGPWLPTRLEEDWEYDCRIGSFGVRLARVEEPVCVHREHPQARLSRGLALDATRLLDRALAHERVLDHARRAGVTVETPEMARYARELFLLARQCGAAGLPAESTRLFALARAASTPRRARGLDFRLYRVWASAVGWRLAGRLSVLSDRVRPRPEETR